MTASPPRTPRVGIAPRGRFLSRVGRSAGLSAALVAVVLAIGTTGYHAIEGLAWLDAFHQASLLLSGMGPVVEIRTAAGKLFDSFFALACGVVLLAATGLVLAPILHRILHRFHLEDQGGGS